MATPIRVVLTLVAVAFVVPATVAATPPATEKMVTDETSVLGAGTAENPCPFDVTYHNQGTFYITTYFDASGTPVRVGAHSRAGGFLETYSANGRELSARSTAVGHIDLATSTLVGTGNQRHFIVPGVGIVYAQAGRFVISFPDGAIISVSGLDVPRAAEFCAALAP